MTNENYLIVSYFIIFNISLGLGIITYKILKNPIMNITRNNKLGKIIKRIFPFGIIFPAIIGFFSVSFKSCDVDTYQKVIQNKSYIIEKNKEQLSETFHYIVIALSIWLFIVMIYWFYRRKITNSEKEEYNV